MSILCIIFSTNMIFSQENNSRKTDTNIDIETGATTNQTGIPENFRNLKIVNITVSGQKHIKTIHFLDEIKKIFLGTTISREKTNLTADLIAKKYAQSGYIYVRVNEFFLKPEKDSQTASLEIKIEENLIKDIEIRGTPQKNDYLTLLDIPLNEPYRETEIQKAIDRIASSDLFKRKLKSIQVKPFFYPKGGMLLGIYLREKDILKIQITGKNTRPEKENNGGLVNLTLTEPHLYGSNNQLSAETEMGFLKNIHFLQFNISIGDENITEEKNPFRYRLKGYFQNENKFQMFKNINPEVGLGFRFRNIGNLTPFIFLGYLYSEFTEKNKLDTKYSNMVFSDLIFSDEETHFLNYPKSQIKIRMTYNVSDTDKPWGFFGFARYWYDMRPVSFQFRGQTFSGGTHQKDFISSFSRYSLEDYSANIHSAGLALYYPFRNIWPGIFFESVFQTIRSEGLGSVILINVFNLEAEAIIGYRFSAEDEFFIRGSLIVRL